jgi:hypothetical protein
MQVTLWARGDRWPARSEMTRYGGNTSCVSVAGDEGTMLVPVREPAWRLAATIPRACAGSISSSRLAHGPHQGLGFFSPLYRPDTKCTSGSGRPSRLEARLMRYLSRHRSFRKPFGVPALVFPRFPAAYSRSGIPRLRGARVPSGPDRGLRITGPRNRVVTYLPDHEPALGALRFPTLPRAWTSGQRSPRTRTC